MFVHDRSARHTPSTTRLYYFMWRHCAMCWLWPVRAFRLVGLRVSNSALSAR